MTLPVIFARATKGSEEEEEGGEAAGTGDDGGGGGGLGTGGGAGGDGGVGGYVHPQSVSSMNGPVVIPFATRRFFKLPHPTLYRAGSDAS